MFISGQPSLKCHPAQLDTLIQGFNFVLFSELFSTMNGCKILQLNQQRHVTFMINQII